LIHLWNFCFYLLPFQFWDAVSTPNPNLGGIVDVYPQYLGKTYKDDLGKLNFVGAVHVETIVGQVEGGYVLDTVGATKFEVAQGKETGFKVGIVPYIHLGREDAAEVIAQHKAVAGDAFRGIRMILNYSKTDSSLCWPQVGRDDFLTQDKIFEKNFSLLQTNNLSFDLHVNWFQLQDAAKFVSRFPEIPIILDHLGVLKLTGKDEAEDSKRYAEWKEGMAALAALPNVNVKLSGPEYIYPNWTSDAAQRSKLVALLKDTISLFGTSRIMVASNYPVDKFMMQDKPSLESWYSSLHAVLSDETLKLGTADFEMLYAGTASKIYGFDKF
jgi:predicted TIM-barrel fold metal-dependent hydrolase